MKQFRPNFFCKLLTSENYAQNLIPKKYSKISTTNQNPNLGFNRQKCHYIQHLNYLTFKVLSVNYGRNCFTKSIPGVDFMKQLWPGFILCSNVSLYVSITFNLF
jgi:hypothetical protein